MLDLNLLFESVWPSVRWLIPFILIIHGIKIAFKAKAQGWLGERAAAGDLDGRSHAALHDVIIPDGCGGLMQIDRLALTGAGILVIETKSFSGRIFGQERDRRWTQRLGARTFKINNPLRQNYGHVQAVKALAGPAVPVSGHVLVAGPADFPKGRPDAVWGRRGFRQMLDERHGKVPSAAWWVAWRALESSASQDASAVTAHRTQLSRRFGRDFRPALGLALIVSGVIVSAWFYLFLSAGSPPWLDGCSM